MFGVQPNFELVENIVVSFVRRDFAVFQVKIVVDLAALAKTIGNFQGCVWSSRVFRVRLRTCVCIKKCLHLRVDSSKLMAI
jgi:hypothetical protein